jgi:hypothetical protein
MSSIDLTVDTNGGYADENGASYQARQDLEEVDVTVQRTAAHVDEEIALLIDGDGVKISVVLDEAAAGPLAELAERDRRAEP